MKHFELTNELQERASLYAAGALPESERAEYEHHVEEDQCDVCRAEIDELQAVMALTALSVPPAMPPAGVKDRLMEQARSASPRKRRIPVFRRRWLELITRAVAIAATVVVLFTLRGNNALRRLNDVLMNRISQLEAQVELQRTLFATLTSPEVRVVTLGGQGANARARGRIFWDQARRRWLVYVRDLPRVPDTTIYQLWFVHKTGNPVSAGTFNTEADGSKQLNIDLQEGLTDLKAAAVTTEPAPGLTQPSGAFALMSE